MENQIDYQKQGKSNRRKGGEWERKVRKYLIEEGWIISKWNNNVDLEEGKIVQAKMKYNFFKKAMSIGTGFPDFVCIKPTNELMFVECKLTGKLDRLEKQKMEWLESEGYDCWVAGKGEGGFVCLERPKKPIVKKEIET